MTQPVNVTEKITGVVGLPGRLHETWTRLRAQSNVRWSELIAALNECQSIFDRIKPMLPTADARFTEAAWNGIAVDRWGASPTGGVVANIGAAAQAGQAVVTTWATTTRPAVLSKLYELDQTTGYVDTDYILTTSEWAAMHTDVDAFIAALEPVAERRA